MHEGYLHFSVLCGKAEECMDISIPQKVTKGTFFMTIMRVVCIFFEILINFENLINFLYIIFFWGGGAGYKYINI